METKKNNMIFVDRLCFDVTKAVSIFDLGDTKAEKFRLMREFTLMLKFMRLAF
jgi:hypothetical protein